MGLYDVLDQIIALLRQRKRLTYRLVKREFALDDETLADLKDELIYAQKLAVEEDERVLVWIGDTEDTHAFPSPPVQTRQPSAIQATQPPHAPLPAPRSLEAERRQLTVMFCDLVDSTALSGQLDPEDYRDVVRAYQTACTEVIRRYDGHIAQLLGDGLLVYFGYPHAHEDDAQRAVRTALGLLAAMADLQTRLHQDKGIQLALRVGIHTGLVVVGAMGSGDRQEQLALGETPNIAARIQGLAAPNTIAISEASYRLVQGYFTCEALGAQTLRGLAEPLHVYRVLQESGATSRLDIVQPRGLTPLVGRESEVTLLLERWAQVKDGQGQVVLLSGEAGIGKSRLVQMLKDHVADEPHVRWECRSSPYFDNTALFPLVDLFQRLLHFHAEDTPNEKVGTLEQMLSQYRLPLEETVPLFASLLSLPISEHRYPPLNLSPQRQRQKTLETLVAILLELAEHQPVLFIVEDLHWTDPSTLELLNLVIDQTPTASIATVFTCRPTFQPTWSHRSYVSEITVNRLSHAQVAQIVNRLTDGKAFPTEVLAQIVERTDGVPLFVEELTKAILESGHLTEVDGHYKLTESFSTFAIPSTLQDSLMARLDRLVTAKAVAQYAAVIGRHFAYDVLSMVSQLDDTTLQRELGRLVEAEIVYQRGVPPQAIYTFKHALIQDVAYQSLLRSTRQQYHQRIAQALEAQFPETVETQPELVAQHYTEASLVAQAIPYWHRAGQRAHARSAHVEAIGHLTKGLELLQRLPDTPERTQHELDLQIALGQALIATTGQAAPEVGHTYNRARELWQQVGEAPQLFRVLYGLHAFHLVRAELRTARELGEELLTLAQHLQDPLYLLGAHFELGGPLFCQGEFVSACEHWEQSFTLYDAQQHHAHASLFGRDLGIFCRAWAPHALWFLGYPDQALAMSREGLALAQRLSHPFSRATALAYTTMLQQFCRESQAVYEQAEAAIALCTEQGFAYYLAWGTTVQGWAQVAQGQDEAGMVQIRRGLAALRATGAALRLPYYLALLAEACGQTGQATEGLALVAEALALVDTTGEHWWEAELHRLRGALLLQHSVPDAQQAAACFHQALDVARRQEAKSLELRAAMSLSRLWQQQGKRAEARALLAPIYGWFTEGFDTADLQDAKVAAGGAGG